MACAHHSLTEFRREQGFGHSNALHQHPFCAWYLPSFSFTRPSSSPSPSSCILAKHPQVDAPVIELCNPAAAAATYNFNFSDVGASEISSKHGPWFVDSSDSAHVDNDNCASPLSTVIKTRNKQLRSKQGVNGGIRGRYPTSANYDWLQPWNLSWAQRKEAIHHVLDSSDGPAMALCRAHKSLEVADYATIMRRLAAHRRWYDTCLAFSWMQENDKVSSPTLANFITSMGRAGLPSRALRAFKKLSSPVLRLNVIVCNSLFKALIFNGKVDATFVLFEKLKLEGLVPDFETYKLLIAGCAKHRGAFEMAETFFQEMQEAGFQPDSFIFTSLLNVCATFGLEAKANTIRKSMESHGVALNSYHYCSLLQLYAQRRKADKAERLFLEMQQNDVTLNKSHLSAMLKVYSNSGLLDKARSYFDGMEAVGFPPQEAAYCIMMDAYTKAGKVDEAHDLLNKMKAKGFKPGCHSYGILIAAYSKLGKGDAVESLVGEINSLLPKESLDLQLFNNLLKTYSEMGQMDGISKTLKTMGEEKVAPDRATYNILISFFSKEQLFDVARDIVQDLLDRRLRPNLNSFAPFILGLLRNGYLDKASLVYDKMRELNIAVSPFFLENVLEILCKSSRIEEAIKYLKSMKASNVFPKSSTLEHLFVSTEGESELLKGIFEASNAASLKAVNFHSVLTWYEQRGHRGAISRILVCMKDHGCQLHAQKLNLLLGAGKV